MKNTYEEMLEVIKAAREGKDIQVFEGGTQWWHDDPHPTWDFARLWYRVKPELPELNVRPYNCSREFMDALKVHGPGIEESPGEFLSFAGASEQDVRLLKLSVKGYTVNFENLLNNFRWQDGTPCGVVIDYKNGGKQCPSAGITA